MKRLKSYKYRIYPTKEQEILLNKTFGCVRFIYNWGLAAKMSAYQQDKKSLSVFTLDKQMTDMKKEEETVWLSEVNSQSLQASLRNLDAAYTNFFRQKKGFPKFKKKGEKESFNNPDRTRVNFVNNKIYLLKFSEGINCVFDREFSGKIKQSTVSKSKTNKYFISILVEEEVSEPKFEQLDESRTLGLDLGLTHFLTDSNGNKIQNPKPLRKNLKKIKKQHKQLSRKKKGSNNRNKARLRLAKTYEKVTNIRHDFLHKLTTSLVKNQDYGTIVIEDLDVSEMVKNKQLAQSIQDVGWYKFRQFLTYKCEWYGKNLLTIGRFEPSSKLCSCGHYNKDLKLSERTWECPSCYTVHDRDVLAANNIKHFAYCKQDTSKQIVGAGCAEVTLGETGR